MNLNTYSKNRLSLNPKPAYASLADFILQLSEKNIEIQPNDIQKL
jgi:hypothetical protein